MTRVRKERSSMPGLGRVFGDGAFFRKDLGDGKPPPVKTTSTGFWFLFWSSVESNRRSTTMLIDLKQRGKFF